MLRITEERKPGEETILHLEGELMGPWVEEVREACERFVGNSHSLRLELADVEYVDREGIALLRGLMNHQVVLINCSSFLAEQLKEVGHHRQSS
jgi:ABC-type transporter Mla MlaB component